MNVTLMFISDGGLFIIFVAVVLVIFVAALKELGNYRANRNKNYHSPFLEDNTEEVEDSSQVASSTEEAVEEVEGDDTALGEQDSKGFEIVEEKETDELPSISTVLPGDENEVK